MNLEELKSLAKKLPEHKPDTVRSAELRMSLLAAAEKEALHRDKSKAWIPLTLAAAAAVAFYAGTRLPASSSPVTASEPKAALAFASLGSSNGANFTRQVNPHTHIEEVRLSEGGLRVDANNSRAILIQTDNAEVRGEAAVFQLVAKANTLTVLQVERGQVELRIANQPAVILGPGQEWNSGQATERIELALRDKTIAETEETEDIVEASENGLESPTTPSENLKVANSTESATPAGPIRDKASVKNTRAREKANQRNEREKKQEVNEDGELTKVVNHPEDAQESPKIAPVEPTPAETAFASGFRAVKQRNYKTAIAAFNLAIDTGADNAMRGDSRYWRSIALAKSGQSAAAMRSMSEFLQHHSSSARAGEVATMLGWLTFEQGKFERAATLFEQGKSDSSAKVRKSAAAGLKAIVDNQ